MKQILVATYIGKIIDITGNTITVRFPLYYKKNVDFKSIDNYPEIQIENPELDQYVEYSYEIELKGKLFISEYFRANPRKFMDMIYGKLVLAPDQKEAKEQYKVAPQDNSEFTPKYKVISIP